MSESPYGSIGEVNNNKSNTYVLTRAMDQNNLLRNSTGERAW